jgi:NADPH:quinone reductase
MGLDTMIQERKTCVGASPMKAVVVQGWTKPSDLSVSQIDPPTVQAGRILIDVKAVACNFSDTLIVQGKYQVKPAFPFSPGGEVAGVVKQLGEGVTNFAVGDRVMAYVEYGGYAERVNARPEAVFPIPENMSFSHAASIPIVYGTSYVSLVPRGMLAKGETVLVTAAAGGVGLATIQIAKALGARVIALAGGSEKLKITLNAGADIAIDYRAVRADRTEIDSGKEPLWVEEVRNATDGRGADVVVENVGGDIFDGCTRCIAWGGRIVVVGFSSGDIPFVKANRIMLKHISLVGVHFGPMAQNAPEELAASFLALMQLYEEGRIRPSIWKELPLEKASEALQALSGRKSWGKIVLTID